MSFPKLQCSQFVIIDRQVEMLVRFTPIVISVLIIFIAIAYNDIRDLINSEVVVGN